MYSSTALQCHVITYDSIRYAYCDKGTCIGAPLSDPKIGQQCRAHSSPCIFVSMLLYAMLFLGMICRDPGMIFTK